MKSFFLSVFVFSVFLMESASGQATGVDSTSADPAPRIEHTVGIDVFKNIPYLLFGNKMPLNEGRMSLTNRGIVEVIWRRQRRERVYQTALLGYSWVEIASPKSVERHQIASGFYGKFGKERILGQGKGRSKVGFRAMATYCRYTTHLVYPGPTFGDYRNSDLVHNVGIGLEPYYALDFPLGPHGVLRWETRWPQHYRVLGKGYTPYYPGVGISLGLYDYNASLGTTLQIHYRFHRVKSH